MRILAIVAALLPLLPASLQAQYRTWEDVCAGASPLPEEMLAAYDPCPMSVPDSIALMTSPRTNEPLGWFGGYSIDGSWLRIVFGMPSADHSIMFEVVEAHCADAKMLPMIVIRCERNHGGVFGDVPGALLTDSLIAAGISEAYIQVRTRDGDLVPARFVPEIDGNEPGPGIVPFVPE